MAIAAIGVGLAAANTGLAFYNSTQGGQGSVYGPSQLQPLTPEEQKFYQLQTLQAEAAATSDEAVAQEQANNSYSASNWLKFAAIGFAIYIVYKVTLKKGLLP